MVHKRVIRHIDCISITVSLHLCFNDAEENLRFYDIAEKQVQGRAQLAEGGREGGRVRSIEFLEKKILNCVHLWVKPCHSKCCFKSI